MSRIAVVSSMKDDHGRAVRDALVERGIDVDVLDALEFPEQIELSLGSGIDDMWLGTKRLERPAAVYLRSLYLSPLAYGVDVSAEMESNWARCMVAFREKAEFMVSILRRWESLGVPIYNALSASDALRKPYQISRLREAGLPVPDTLWSNDPEQVSRFAAGRRVAYKPVSGGAATQELQPEDLTPERLSALSGAPVTFQELLPGQDIRVFVIDGRVVAAFRIEATHIDFRQNESKIEAFEADAELRDVCIRACEVLNLRFTGMDLKSSSDGTLKILELNGSPMFLGFDHLAGTQVLTELVNALAFHTNQVPSQT